MYLGRGEGEGQDGRDVKHEPENMLALNCHHTAVGRSEPEKLATNTRTQTHARHTPRRSRGVCEQPRSSYLGCLGSLCSQCTTLSSLSPIFPPCGEQRGRCRCCGGVTVQVGDSRQLAAASAAGLWLLPGLLLLMMMPRRRRAEWGGGGCWRWCCCHGYSTQWQQRRCSAQQLPQSPDLLGTHHGQTALDIQTQVSIFHPRALAGAQRWWGGRRSLPGAVPGLRENIWSDASEMFAFCTCGWRARCPTKVKQQLLGRRPGFHFLGVLCIFIRNQTK